MADPHELSHRKITELSTEGQARVNPFHPAAERVHVHRFLVASEAQDRQSVGAAESAARRMAETAAGAVAFSRTGDPATGKFEDAVVLREFGEVPSFKDLLIGGRRAAGARFSRS